VGGGGGILISDLGSGFSFGSPILLFVGNEIKKVKWKKEKKWKKATSNVMAGPRSGAGDQCESEKLLLVTVPHKDRFFLCSQAFYMS
jgi:hypothetical protein